MECCLEDTSDQGSERRRWVQAQAVASGQVVVLALVGLGKGLAPSQAQGIRRNFDHSQGMECCLDNTDQRSERSRWAQAHLAALALVGSERGLGLAPALSKMAAPRPNTTPRTSSSHRPCPTCR